MVRCGVAVVAVLVLTPALAAAQTAPPGLVPIFPPGAKPGSAPAPPPAAPAYGEPTPPAYAGYWPGYPALSFYRKPEMSELRLPDTLYYEDGQTVPEGYQIKSRVIRSFIVAGSIGFGAAYLSSFIGAAAVVSGGGSNAGQLAPLFAPVVGPFIAVGTSGSTGPGTVWLVLDGLAQTGGAVMFVYGLAAEEKYLTRASSGRASPLDVLSHPQVFVGGPAAMLRWTM